jgi:Predicted xylanase/chitin deacetylase
MFSSVSLVLRLRHTVAVSAGVFCILAGISVASIAADAASTAPAIASSAPAPSWAPDAQDARKALRNDATPPAKREPSVMLPPLGPDAVGTIRRVALADGAKVVALTFDLCELDTVTTGCDMDILGFLRAEHIPATLFMGGKWMRTHSRPGAANHDRAAV